MQRTVAAGEQDADLATIFADDRAFQAWYTATLPRIYGYLFNRCGRDHALAEELTQQTFVEAIRSHRRFAGRADPVTWLTSIARHRLVDHYRQVERQQRRLSALFIGEPDATAFGADGWDARDGVEEALGHLAPLQRAVLVLHYMDRLSVRDVAHTIGKSEAAATSLLARGREAFRQAMKELDR